jgi:YVTN family beta-propeller protein
MKLPFFYSSISNPNNMKDRIMTFLRTFFIAVITISLGLISGTAEAQSSQKMYVCNQGSATLMVIDTETHEITETIDLQDLGFSANAKPHHAIAEADGSFWYVTLIGENTVLKFNRDNELVGQTRLEVPGLMTMNPNRGELYVGRSMSAVNPPQSFGMIQRSDMSLEKEVDLFFSRPHAIASSSNGWTFIASLSANQMLSMNTESEESNLINVEGDNNVFVNFAISPDANTMVATGQITGKLLVFDISDPANPELTNSIGVNAMPWHPVYSPDGKYVYFANKGANTVTVVNMETKEVDAVIEGNGLAQPHGAALTADGKYLYVTNNNLNGMYQPETTEMENPPGTVTVINTETRSIEKVIEVGNYPTGIGTNVQ